MNMEQAVDRFRELLRTGTHPRIETFIEPLGAQDAARELFAGLVYEEFYHSAQAGSPPQLKSFNQRFPAYQTEISEAWSQVRIDLKIIEGMPAADTPSTMVPKAERVARTAAPGAKLPAIEGFEILEEIARGGMGVVYKARQASLGRVVAIKVVLAAELADPEELRRFKVEAEAQARLQHPNIVQVFESGEYAGHPYLCMEFVDGSTLQARMRKQAFDPREAAKIVEKLAGAMGYAHGLGVIHRDLKPANVLIAPDGEPKITDFGLAKRLDSGVDLTQSGAILGTPQYMAPEQAAGDGRRISRLTDVYGLGTILYELLTQRAPFSAPDVVSILRQVMADDPLTPSSLHLKVPPDLETICLKCLEKDPLRRYASAHALAEDLNRFLRNKIILGRRATMVYRGVKWCLRNAVVFALMIVLTILAVVSGAEAVHALRSASEAKVARENSDSLVKEFSEQRKLCKEAFDPLDAKIVAAAQIKSIPSEVRRALHEAASARVLVTTLLKDDAPDDQYLLPNAYMRAGRAYYDIADYAHAVEKHGLAVQWLEKMTPPTSNEALFKYKLKLADALELTGVATHKLIRIEPEWNAAVESIRYHERALKLRQEADELFPNNTSVQLSLSFSLTNLADCGYGGKSKELYQKTLEIRRRGLELNPNDKRIRVALAHALDMQRNLSASREAVAICRKLTDDYPTEIEYRYFLGVYVCAVGRKLEESGNLTEGIRAYRESVAELEKCRLVRPFDTETLFYLLGAHRQLAMALLKVGRKAEAIDIAKRELEIGRQTQQDGQGFPTDKQQEALSRWLENPAGLLP